MTLDARTLAGIDRSRLEQERWFAGKGRGIAALNLADALPIPGLREGYLLLVDVAYRDAGEGERYLMPAWISGAGRVWEPAVGEGFWLAVVDALRGGGQLPGVHGAFAMRPAPSLQGDSLGLHGERGLGVDQSNTSVVLGERLVLKAYRHLDAGVHPEVEMGEALAGFRYVPAYEGSIHHIEANGSETAIAILQRFVPDAEDGWEGIIGRLTRAITLPPGVLDLEATTDEVAAVAQVMGELHVTLAQRLGTRKAEATDLFRWREAAETQLERALFVVDGDAGDELRECAARIRRGLAAFEHVDPPTLCRVHGDLHYAQFLQAPAGIFVVDFEGEPTRSPEERRRFASPLRDVACFVRSLDHIARTAELRSHGAAERGLDVDAWIERATERAGAAYSAVLAASDTGLRFDPVLLHAFELEKETYEFIYAAKFLPSWLYAPRLGMRWLLRSA